MQQFFTGLAELLVSAGWLVLQTWLLVHATRRVLGVRIGWLRAALVSGLVMVGGMGLVQWFLAGRPPVGGVSTGPWMLVLVVVVLWGFAISAAILVGLEVLWPSGSLPPARTLLFGWRRRFLAARRYAQLTAIAAKHGLGAPLRGFRSGDQPSAVARELRLALQESGVSFVKLGQMLSTRGDLLPPPYVRELSHLTNQVPPIPWETARDTIETELGRPVGEVVASVEEEPLASASLAQVHAGELPDGRGVVLKVQRPGAAAQVALDVAMMRRLAARLERSARWARSLGVADLVDGFAASLDEELDYRVEIDNMTALRRSTLARGVRIPDVLEELSTSRLIVMERLDGTPLAQAGELLRDLPDETRRAAARRLLTTVLAQVLDDGIFHADLHPGNVLLWPDGTVGLLDFGSVGRLDAPSRKALAMLVWAIDADDPALATDCLLQLLDRPDQLDERGLQRAVGQLVTRYRGGLGRGGSMAVFGQLLEMVMAHGFRVPAPVAAALRSLGALEGTLTLLDPSLDLVDAAREVERDVMGEVTPASVKEQLAQRLVRLLPLLENLPQRVDRISQDLAEGRFQVRVRAFGDPADRRFVTVVVQQLVLAVLAGAGVLGGIVLATSSGGGELLPGVPLFVVLGYLLAFAGFVLALRAVALLFSQD